MDFDQRKMFIANYIQYINTLIGHICVFIHGSKDDDFSNNLDNTLDSIIMV